MAAIIFDFDGTIADTLDYFIDFLAKEAHHEQLSSDERRALRGLSLAVIARRLGHPWWRLPGLYYKGRRLMEPRMKDMKPFVGMPKLIRKLHREGHELFIISSNSVHNMRSFLRRHGLRTSFLEIYGGVVVFGKAPTIKQLLKDHGIQPKDAIYVGDELRDLQAAAASGIRSVGVTWGFAGRQSLVDERPAAVVDTPAQLMRILEEI